MRAAHLLCVTAIVGGVGPAAAETIPAADWRDGRVYVALGPQIRASRFGRFNALNEALTPAFATQLDVAPTLVSAGPAGTIGFVIDDDAPLVRRLRVEFSGAYRIGSGDYSATPYSIATAFGPSALFALLSIDGQQGLLFGATPFEDGVAGSRWMRGNSRAACDCAAISRLARSR